jgi:hypothetical protein
VARALHRLWNDPDLLLFGRHRQDPQLAVLKEQKETRTMTNNLAKLLTLGSSMVLCACPVANPDYPGEPLLTLNGSVQAALEEEAAQLQDPHVSLVWLLAGAERSVVGSIATSVAVDGSFPADFELNVYVPPPPEATHENGVAVAIIAVIDGEPVGQNVMREELLGVAPNDLLVFSDSEQELDSITVSEGLQVLRIEQAETSTVIRQLDPNNPNDDIIVQMGDVSTAMAARLLPRTGGPSCAEICRAYLPRYVNDVNVEEVCAQPAFTEAQTDQQCCDAFAPYELILDSCRTE